MIRVLDFIFSAIGLLMLLPVIVLLTLAGLFDTGSPFFTQTRVGRHQKPFTLIKFRTMRKDTASVATHLVNSSSVTPLGSFLRKSKLDELPQLWNVLCGDMSLVGPRPGLFNQDSLTAERLKRGVFDVRPGITGLGQISDIDMSTPERLAKADSEMIATLNLGHYFGYIVKTLLGSGRGDRVTK